MFFFKKKYEFPGSSYILIVESNMTDSLKMLTRILCKENYYEAKKGSKDWRWIHYDIVEIEGQVTIISENRSKQWFPNQFYDFTEQQLLEMSVDLGCSITVYDCFENEHYAFAKYSNGKKLITADFIAGGPPTIIQYDQNDPVLYQWSDWGVLFKNLQIPLIEESDMIFKYLKSLPNSHILFQYRG